MFQKKCIIFSRHSDTMAPVATHMQRFDDCMSHCNFDHICYIVYNCTESEGRELLTNILHTHYDFDIDTSAMMTGQIYSDHKSHSENLSCDPESVLYTFLKNQEYDEQKALNYIVEHVM